MFVRRFAANERGEHAGEAHAVLHHERVVLRDPAVVESVPRAAAEGSSA